MKNKIHWGGILLVAGTCIGAGMIGVPVKTATAGLYCTLLAFLAFWLITTWCGLLFVEIALGFKGEVNFISMVKEILGNFHKNVAWVIYLLFMYSIMAGYTAGGAGMVQQWFKHILPINIYLAIPIFLLPFISIIYLGSKWIDFINRFLTSGLIISFLLLCVGAFGGVKFDNNLQNNLLLIGDFKAILFALPVLSATFSYHIIIPSLKTYLQSQITPLKQAIWLGGLIPLIVYVAWQLSILFLIPTEGKQGLISMLHANKNPTDSIINYLTIHNQYKSILILISIFLFCALTSSLIGAGWALVDFLADGLKIAKNRRGKIILSLLSFIPPIIYTVFFPQGFLKAVGYAGAFSAILTIIYPALMVWRLRHNKHLIKTNLISDSNYKAPVGNKRIIFIFLFGMLIVFLELLNNF